ncbi:MAG: universal stress protein UspA [Clostridia bacterium]|nr:universal stress protein UspA [Clostridia bacterium]MBR3460858.1 universal stress protein UspA [Clostridia bacterium]MBR5718308.1 universal stress protein UspA [Clostridia bacterium]
MSNTKNKAIMICVTNQLSCERLIRYGAKRSESPEYSEKPPIYVVHCVQNDQRFMGANNQEDAISSLFAYAAEIGAELTVLRSNNVQRTLANFAEEHDVGVMILGSPKNSGSRNNRFSRKLQELLPNVEFDIR